MIDLEQVRKVAHLARLDLTPDEEAILPQQLSGILDYVEQLSELDTDGVEPTTRAIDVSNIFREDTQKTFGDRESLLENAPEREADFFRVPQIMGDSE
ncbi:Asp-tRNA(Asn)/Glu-tRNA(Gln) amidotransferase subunit GatC [[Limnothrix rosea] IAM M-220]|uniref:Asp-tRNA(Asn)/Glu-tRNA(Gln) amidotransferase subunit GatC n=1 Tax=[Limnothrix rosea] IAM M-220 TaxID=454133 RepID=UPI0009653ECC|nr:Asp-tRNA(Asn)/Glu-tRNA(Gln) amidotransferase subunit GatC [[Limnothrix rosea] IAM M-220]OKH13178.1 asparaginyl/glutamyl-tRNA amidotransferase subunit C [[Limnothrix rosea] IAM M-220]